MQIASPGGVKLEFDMRGSGEPVVLVHGSAVADSYLPMVSEPSLGRFRLVRYRRRGYGGVGHAAAPGSIGEHAADCAALMRHLEISRAHLVGHSYGGVIAIQVALDFPETVNSLTLLEPALIRFVPVGAEFLQGYVAVMTKYRSGNRRGALEGFMELVGGPKWRDSVERVTGAMEMALADIETVFEAEGAAMQRWTFDADEALRIKQPVLAMVGSESVPLFREIHELVRAWFPRAELTEIEGAGHMLQMEKASAVAERLADFFARHPITAADEIA